MVEDHRRRKYGLRAIWNALFYLNQEGCRWRSLPRSYPPWKLVYYYFQKWHASGLFLRVCRQLRRRLRRRLGRHSSASCLLVDAQSVKTLYSGAERGLDAYKKVKGRKRHLLVDTLGLLVAVVISAANVHESQALDPLLESGALREARRHLLIGDSAYTGATSIAERYGMRLEISRALESAPRSQCGRFPIAPMRWIVERSFAWFGNARRLSKDYERSTASSTAMILLAAIRGIASKLSRSPNS